MSRKVFSFCLLLCLCCALSFQQWACLPVLCERDADCASASPDTPYCHFAKCKVCVVDRHCGGIGQRCLNDRCVKAGELPPSDASSPESQEEVTSEREPIEGKLQETRTETSTCPNACNLDEDCASCSERTICFQGQCTKPACPGECANDQNCRLCPGGARTCVEEPQCSTPNCAGLCGDPTCNPFGCTSDDDCKGCKEGKVFCDSPDGSTLGSCTPFSCPTSCKGNSECVGCAQGNVCQNGTCSGWSACQTDEDCRKRSNPKTPLCNTRTGQCVGCLNANDCKTPGLAFCLKSTGRCVACEIDSDCQNEPSRKRCKMTNDSALCVECTEDAHCPSKAKGSCDLKQNACYLPEGHLCTKASRCVQGTTCKSLPGIANAQSYCFRGCTIPNACLKGQLCVMTSNLSSGAVCLKGCQTNEDCGSAGKRFKCHRAVFGKGQVCTPSDPATVGFIDIGGTCDPNSSLCRAPLICLRPAGGIRGYCTLPCRSNNECGKTPSGRETECLRMSGELTYCGIPCNNANSNCPNGFRCDGGWKYCAP